MNWRFNYRMMPSFPDKIRWQLPFN